MLPDNPTVAPACPVSDAILARVRTILQQLDEGAITAPEAANAIAARVFVEDFDAVAAEWRAQAAYFGEPA